MRLIIISIISLIALSICAQNNFGGEGPLIKNRIYTEVGIETISPQEGLSLGLRWKLGGNLYFLDRYIYTIGLNLNILGGSVGFGPNSTLHITTPGIGPSFLLRTGEEHGIEVNLPLGYGIYNTEEISGAGLYYIADVKWRKNDWAFGIAYNGYFNADKTNRDYFDSLALTASWQFSTERFTNSTRIFLGGLIF